jgi:hypothetical protein
VQQSACAHVFDAQRVVEAFLEYPVGQAKVPHAGFTLQQSDCKHVFDAQRVLEAFAE